MENINNHINVLSNCILFKRFSEHELINLLNSIKCKIHSYQKEEIIAMEEQECSSIGIVLEGHVEVQKIFVSGKMITITRLKPKDIFGEVIIFSDYNKYPATIVSNNSSKVMFISKDEIANLCKINTHFLENFIGLLSGKILMLNKKLKTLSLQTIRQKISNYLLEEYYQQKKNLLTLPYSRKELAEQLGIPRPSLSRELVNMKKDHLIDFYKNTIKITDIAGLESCLYE